MANGNEDGGGGGGGGDEKMGEGGDMNRVLVETKVILGKDLKQDSRSLVNVVLNDVLNDNESEGEFHLSIRPGQILYSLSVSLLPEVTPVADASILTQEHPPVCESSFDACVRVLLSDNIHPGFLKVAAANFLLDHYEELKNCWLHHPYLLEGLFRLCNSPDAALLERVFRLVLNVAEDPSFSTVEVTPASVACIVPSLSSLNPQSQSSALTIINLLAKRSDTNKVAIGHHIQSVINLLGNESLGPTASSTLHELFKVGANVHVAMGCDLQPAIQNGAVRLQFSLLNLETPAALLLLCTDDNGAAQLVTLGATRQLLRMVDTEGAQSFWDLCLVALHRLWNSLTVTRKQVWGPNFRSLVSRIAQEGEGETSTNASALLVLLS